MAYKSIHGPKLFFHVVNKYLSRDEAFPLIEHINGRKAIFDVEGGCTQREKFGQIEDWYSYFKLYAI